MNFFQHQDQARKNTTRLVFLFGLAVLTLIAVTNVLVIGALTYGQGLPLTEWQAVLAANPDLVWFTVLGITAVVGLGSLYKLAQLSGGGRAVAEAMGGRLLNLNSNDADERKVLNVVAEMALASGTPVPPVYIMEEDSINAFAAGYKPADAVIGVTRGCIRLLNRQELQGVVAHEFSHILHGDMRLNLRLVGVLHGILVIGILGYQLMRVVSYGGHRRSGKNDSALPLIALGAGLMVIGYAGTFFGNLIKSAVSRQREFLADASAVQFTRDPSGISGALQKIGGYSLGSKLDNPAGAEMSHMFFGQALNLFMNGMMATHPPLPERINRVDPGWSGQFPSVSQPRHSAPMMEMDEASAEQSMGFAGMSSGPVAAGWSEQLIGSIGEVDLAHLSHAEAVLAALPKEVIMAVQEPWAARALVYLLLLDDNLEVRQQQLNTLAQNADTAVYKMVQQWQPSLILEPVQRLPIVDLCMPALKQLSPAQYQVFKTNVQALVKADGRVELFEWALYMILVKNLEQAPTSLRQRGEVRSLKSVARACNLVLSAVAGSGADQPDQAIASFEQAKQLLGLPRLQYQATTDLNELSRAVAVLNRLKPLLKPRLLKALCAAVTHDGEVRSIEVELVRAIADGLDCPMPPLIQDH